MVYDFTAKDGVRRVARFRAIPADGSKESGRLTPEEQREAWYSLYVHVFTAKLCILFLIVRIFIPTVYIVTCVNGKHA